MDGPASYHTFFLILTATSLFCLALGWRITKTWRGLFIDARCRVSLSRFQIICWSVLVLSSIVWLAISSKSTNIYVPETLWALMGVAGFSAVGSEVVKGTKAAKKKASGLDTPALRRMGPEAQMGLLKVNPKPHQARFADMFKGEALLDFEYVDITKVQMFLITIFLLGAYGYAILSNLVPLTLCETGQEAEYGKLCMVPENAESAASSVASDGVATADKEPEFQILGYALPKFTEGLVGLLAVSHGSYVSFKAAPKTPSAPDPA